MLSLIGVALMTTAPATSHAIDAQSIADDTYDILVLRSLGAFSTLVGGVMFIPAALFSLPNGRDGVDESWQIFVEHQWEETFERPLGDF